MTTFFPLGPGQDLVRPVMAEQHNRAATLDIVAQPILARLVRYWLSRRNGAAMPTRASIDPIDIPWALSRLFLVDCVPVEQPAIDGGRWRYRYRLAGEEIEAMFRREDRVTIRGQWLEDVIPAEAVAAVMTRWRPVPDQAELVYMHGLIYQLAHRAARGGRLLLPLCEEPGGPVTGLLGATEYSWVERPKHADITITRIRASDLA